MLPVLVLIPVVAALALALYERGHGQDPVGLSVWQTLQLHWRALWHHDQAQQVAPLDPPAAADHANASAAAGAQADAQLDAAKRSVKTPKQQALVDIATAYMTANIQFARAQAALAAAPTPENAATAKTAAVARDAARARLAQLTGKDIP